MSGPGTGPVAAVDIGTNSVRLLVQDGPRTLARRTTVTRLGRGLGANGAFDPGALARTVEVLEAYRDEARAAGATRLRAVATSAARDAADRDLLLDRAEAALGVRPEILTGDQEGRLALAGATAGLDPGDGPFLVLDIGGGSTEFVVGTGDDVAAWSCDVGAVRLTESQLQHDPPQPEELSNAISVVDVHLDDVVRELPSITATRRVVGVAGTITTVAAVEIGLLEYDRDRIHHFVLSRAAVEDVFRTLATEALADRVHNPGLPPDRADIIVGGLCVLVATMRRFEIAEVLVSETDMLDALARSLLEP